MHQETLADQIESAAQQKQSLIESNAAQVHQLKQTIAELHHRLQTTTTTTTTTIGQQTSQEQAEVGVQSEGVVAGVWFEGEQQPGATDQKVCEEAAPVPDQVVTVVAATTQTTENSTAQDSQNDDKHDDNDDECHGRGSSVSASAHHLSIDAGIIPVAIDAASQTDAQPAQQQIDKLN